MSQSYSFKVKFEGKTKPVEYLPEGPNATVGDLRRFLATEYRITNTKILKLIKGKTINADSDFDEIPLRTLPLKRNQRVVLMGSAVEELIKFANTEATGKIIQEEYARQEREQQEELARQEQAREEKRRREMEAEAKRRREAEERRRQREAEERQRRAAEAAARPHLDRLPSPGANETPFATNLQGIRIANERIRTVNLPTGMLQDLLHHGAPTPYTFNITNINNGRSAVAVAPTFDGTQGSIEIPTSMWEKLGVDQNSLRVDVRIETMVVPLGEYARFKPLNVEWDHISFQEQQALMELILRHRQVLTVGEIIDFHYCDLRICLEVEETKPEAVISILNTDLQTDFAMTEERELKLEKGTWLYRKKQPHEIIEIDHSLDPPAVSLRDRHGRQIGSELDRCSQHHPFVDLTLRAVNINTPISDALSAREWHYFKFTPQSPQPLKITLSSPNGDADVFVINENVISSSRWPLPCRELYHWKNDDSRSEKEIILSSSDLRFKTGVEYRIGIGSLKNESIQYRLSISTANERPEMDAMDIEEAQSGRQECAHCLKQISSGAFFMHSMRCERIHQKCEVCSKPFKKDALGKHEKTAHTPLRCACGTALEPDELQAHYKDCMEQMVRCYYCPLWIRRQDRGDHHSECGNMRSICSFCGGSHRRVEMKRHIHREHGVPNDEITYKSWWVS